MIFIEKGSMENWVTHKNSMDEEVNKTMLINSREIDHTRYESILIKERDVEEGELFLSLHYYVLLIEDVSAYL